MRNFTWNRFPIKNLLIDYLLTPIVESTYLHILYMPICLAHKKYFSVGLWCETQNKDLAHCNINSNKKPTVFKCHYGNWITVLTSNSLDFFLTLLRNIKMKNFDFWNTVANSLFANLIATSLLKCFFPWSYCALVLYILLHD